MQISSEDSGFRAISDAFPAIFKTIRLFSWNVDEVNFHCLELQGSLNKFPDFFLGHFYW